VLPEAAYRDAFARPPGGSMTARSSSRRSSGSWGIWLIAAAFAVGLPGCGTNLPEEEQGLRDALHTNFAGWKMVTAHDLTRDQQAKWSAEHPGLAPGVTSGDYFGDGSKSFAVLLTKAGQEGRRMRLVVLKPTQANGRFETFFLFSESPADTMPQIFTSKAGEYQVFLEGQSVPVPTAGVVYNHGASQQKLFFWNVDRFQDIELAP
jgi:hypothetical protein